MPAEVIELMTGELRKGKCRTRATLPIIVHKCIRPNVTLRSFCLHLAFGVLDLFELWDLRFGICTQGRVLAFVDLIRIIPLYALLGFSRSMLMPLVCARCRRTLPSSEDPPSFCAYCGQRLSDASQPTVERGLDLGSTIGHESAPELPPEETTPAEIGGYKLLRLIGAGGMGRVFEAQSLATGQKVAVKLLSSRFTNNPVSLERFRQEGRLASQISHPRCVFVLAADTENDRPYIVMELMQGETLRDLLQRRGPLPPQEAIAVILDVIEGLQEAHQLGVIHRDVKPSNCFLMADGHVKVGDFGLSKSLARTVS